MRTIGIMYHDVVDPGDWESSGFAGAGADVYKISIPNFRFQLGHLRSRGISPRLITDSSIDDNGNGNDVFITFDDGGESAYIHASGLLEEYG